MYDDVATNGLMVFFSEIQIIYSPSTIISLSSHHLMRAQKEVLKMGLTFCPPSSLDTYVMLNARKLLLRVLHSDQSTNSHQDEQWTGAFPQDVKNLKTLFKLLQENESVEFDNTTMDFLEITDTSQYTNSICTFVREVLRDIDTSTVFFRLELI